MTDLKKQEARARIGARLRSLREENRMTQQQVADQIGIAMQTVSKIEGAKWNFGTDIIEAYANLFGKKIEIL